MDLVILVSAPALLTLCAHLLCLPFLQDSLLAAPIVMDLIILAELITRIQFKQDGQEQMRGFHPVAVLLSYLTKAPLVRAAAGKGEMEQSSGVGNSLVIAAEFAAEFAAECWARC